MALRWTSSVVADRSSCSASPTGLGTDTLVSASTKATPAAARTRSTAATGRAPANPASALSYVEVMAPPAAAAIAITSWTRAAAASSSRTTM